MKRIKRKVLLIGGARPNFMKIAPLFKQMRKHVSAFQTKIVHTGQHYDHKMSEIFFKELGLPEPDIYLRAGSGSHGSQTAKIIQRFEGVCQIEKPDMVIVVGDVNSTLAVSIVTSKLLIPLVHIEAGLRSFDRTMPEEINRIVTDSLSDILFTTCLYANKNLKKEGIPNKKIYFVGNVMIDTLKDFEKKSSKSEILNKQELKKKKYALMTLHRPSNVDSGKAFERILKALKELSKEILILFPVHPRTSKQIQQFKFQKYFSDSTIRLIDPVGYMDSLKLIKNALFVLTDSGGMQEETTVLGVPCVTLRENTERPVTVKEGTSTLAGNDPEKILSISRKILSGKYKKGKIPQLWDGKTSQRIVSILQKI